jgi:hypothetical protein
VDGEPAHRKVLVVPYRTQTREHIFRNFRHWKKDRFKIQDLLADKRCSRAVLDLLSTPDVARRVPARLRMAHRVRRRSENSGSGEKGKRRRHRGSRRGDRGSRSWATRVRNSRCSSHALLHGLYGGGVGSLGAAFFCLSLVISYVISFAISLVRSISFGSGLGGGQRGATTGHLQTDRGRGVGQWTGTGQFVYRKDLEMSHAINEGINK